MERGENRNFMIEKLQHRSIQEFTDGIGDKIEYFNDAPDKKAKSSAGERISRG